MASFLRFAGHTLPLGKKTYLMGIVNVTPDSFSDGGQYFNTEEAIRQVASLARDGADIIDIGGESTRPGHAPVGETEELMRVLPVLENFPKSMSLPVSVDTTKIKVTRMALEAGAAIVNCVANIDDATELLMAAAEYQAGFIITHNEPDFMSETNAMYRISRYFDYAVRCAYNSGLSPENLVLDPGIGFGKTQEQNIEILAGLSGLKTLGFPILVGLSRKSFIGTVTGLPPEKRDIPTIAANALAIAGGADIIRVHNVAAHVSAIKICDAIARL